MDSQDASFTAGTTDRLVLTQARAHYQASEIAHLDTVVAAQQAAGTLEDSMQRPRPDDEVCVVRAVRAVVRQRELLTEQGSWVQRMQKALLQMNLQLTKTERSLHGAGVTRVFASLQ